MSTEESNWPESVARQVEDDHHMTIAIEVNEGNASDSESTNGNDMTADNTNGHNIGNRNGAAGGSEAGDAVPAPLVCRVRIRLIKLFCLVAAIFVYASRLHVNLHMAFFVFAGVMAVGVVFYLVVVALADVQPRARKNAEETATTEVAADMEASPTSDAAADGIAMV